MHLDPVLLGPPKPSSCPEHLLVTTWNVWFDKYQREQRNHLLLSTLARHRPHLMAFQEVTPPFTRALQSQEWLREAGYWVSAVEHSRIGAVLVGRVPLQSLTFVPLESSMGRRLLVARLEGGPTVATCHFESTASAGAVRGKQFQQTFEHLAQDKAVVVLGDFNCSTEDPECTNIPPDVVDSWALLHPGDPGYSMDSTVNGMLAKTVAGLVQKRIDRVLSRGAISPLGIERLGTEPDNSGLFASDHFGLVTNLQHGR